MNMSNHKKLKAYLPYSRKQGNAWLVLQNVYGKNWNLFFLNNELLGTEDLGMQNALYPDDAG